MLAGACLFAARALRPWRSGASDDPEARAHAARIVAQHATDTLAPFTLRADKQFFFAVSGDSFISYRVLAGVALVSGDPVGDEAAFPALIEAFARFAERRGWTVGVLGVSAQRLPLWRDAGLRAHYTGDEAIVDACAFSLEGRAIRKVRQSVTRLERAGYSAQAVHSGEIDEALAERIAEIAARWRGDAGETGYSMAFAGATVDRTRDDLYVIARDDSGEPRGFLHFGTVPGGRALSLSSMRRDRDTPNGLNEFLICRALDYAREHGIERVSLELRRVRPPARSPGPARSALARGAARAGATGQALPARAPALVQPEVRARVDAALCGLPERGDTSAHRARGHARRGLPDAPLGTAAGTAGMTPALAGGLGLALASALALDAGFLIQQHAVAHTYELSLRRPLASARSLFESRRWLAGFFLGLAGWGLYFAALTLAPLSLVQTVAASGIGLLVVLVAVASRKLPVRREQGGALLATLGLMALAVSAGRSGATPSSAPSTVGLCGLVAAALVIVACALRGRSAALGGLAAGLCYGVGDVTASRC